MIFGTLILALALNAHDTFKDSKVVLANGDTLSGPGKIITNENGMWKLDEYVGLSLGGKTYRAEEIKSARIGKAKFLSLRKDGGSYLGEVVLDGMQIKTLAFSPASYSEGFTNMGGGPGGNLLPFGGGTSNNVDYYTVNMQDAQAIKYGNLLRDLGDCPASRKDLMIHKTLVYAAIGSAASAAVFGITAAILWKLNNKSHSSGQDALINGLGATAGVSGAISIGCVLGLGTNNFDRFLRASIDDYARITR